MDLEETVPIFYPDEGLRIKPFLIGFVEQHQDMVVFGPKSAAGESEKLIRLTYKDTDSPSPGTCLRFFRFGGKPTVAAIFSTSATDAGGRAGIRFAFGASSGRISDANLLPNYLDLFTRILNHCFSVRLPFDDRDRLLSAIQRGARSGKASEALRPVLDHLLFASGIYSNLNLREQSSTVNFPWLLRWWRAYRYGRVKWIFYSLGSNESIEPAQLARIVIRETPSGALWRRKPLTVSEDETTDLTIVPLSFLTAYLSRAAYMRVGKAEGVTYIYVSGS
jgi:hypothetical protein